MSNDCHHCRDESARKHDPEVGGFTSRHSTKRLGHEVVLIDPAEMPPETFTPASYDAKPAALAAVARALASAAGVIVVTPEYNGGIPGVLKYLLDLLPTRQLFEHRPVGFVGVAAGAWGALRPVEHLQAVFGYRNAFLFPDRVFIPHCDQVIDADGRVSDPEVARRLSCQAVSFLEFSGKLRELAPNKPRAE